MVLENIGLCYRPELGGAKPLPGSELRSDPDVKRTCGLMTCFIDGKNYHSVEMDF